MRRANPNPNPNPDPDPDPNPNPDPYPNQALARITTYRESGEPTMAWLREQRVPIIELDCSGTPAEVWEQLPTLLYS